MSRNKIRIVLAEDEVLVAESLSNVLKSKSKDIEIVGVAYNGRDAIKCVESSQPDIVLMAVGMPGLNGLETARLMHERHPEVKIVMLTTHDDPRSARIGLRYGAVGYLLKDISPYQLIQAVRSIHDGLVILSPGIARELAGSEPLDSTDQGPEEERFRRNLKNLSKREREVLDLLAKGYDNQRIAESLYVSRQTVKNHLSRIYTKLEVQGRTQALILLHLAGIDPKCTAGQLLD